MVLFSPRRDLGEFRKRYKWMGCFAALLFAVILGRLLQLQVWNAEHFRTLAHQNITQTQTLPASRGLIFDTEQRLIAGNEPAYDLLVTPSLLGAPGVQERLVALLDLDKEATDLLQSRMDALPVYRRNHQVLALRSIKRDQLAAVEAHRNELPGVEVRAVAVRHYPFGSLGGHAIGYLSEVSKAEIAAQPNTYRLGDLGGRFGIERMLEAELRGARGFRSQLVDARGRILDELILARSRGALPVTPLTHRPPAPGADVQLTLDMDLMRVIRKLVSPYPAASIAVVEAQTGMVRALYSKPSYDLNEITGFMSQKSYDALIQNPHRPLIDRTLYETYFPGSTFKPVTALAALADGLVDPKASIHCGGYHELGNRRFRCTHVHGDVDMQQALGQSCNVYFYKLAEIIGVDRLAHYARAMGFGEPTGIGLENEASGFIATREWYEKRYQRPYRSGFTLNAAIGQGNTRASVLQIAMAYAALSNGGNLLRPSLVERITSHDGEPIFTFTPTVRQRLPISLAHLDTMLEGLRLTVADRSGTAFDPKRKDSVSAGGKTGTAQVTGLGGRSEDDPLAWFFRRSHAWFAGFAPFNNPEFVVVVLVEHGGAGGRTAAPIGLDILNYVTKKRAAARLAGGTPDGSHS